MGELGPTCAACGRSYPKGVLFCPDDGTPVAPQRAGGAPIADPYLGRVLPGGIRLEKLVGAGTMGRVYLGIQQGLDRQVAVKILRHELSSSPSVVARFEREADIVRRLVHPHLVQVFASGRLDASGTGPGALYMVMEYLDGISLRSAMSASGGHLAAPRAVRIVLDAAHAVAEAHRQGIVHRDLSPLNILLVRRKNDADFVKVVDFGLARLMRPEGGLVTEAGLVFGTPYYMSPEGAAGERVGPAADVYALATILYESLTGARPFAGAKGIDVMTDKMGGRPRPLDVHTLGRAVPGPLAEVIMQNLSRGPESRAQDARVFADSLAKGAQKAGIDAAPLGQQAARQGRPAPTARFGSGGAGGTQRNAARRASRNTPRERGR